VKSCYVNRGFVKKTSIYHSDYNYIKERVSDISRIWILNYAYIVRENLAWRLGTNQFESDRLGMGYLKILWDKVQTI